MKSLDLKNISKSTIARSVALIVVLINQGLVLFGKEMLPFTEDEVYQGVSMVLTVVMAIMAWWKNNSFTNVAIEADKYKENLIKTQQLTNDEYFTDEEYENE